VKNKRYGIINWVVLFSVTPCAYMYHRIPRGDDLSSIKLYGKNLAMNSPVLARLAALIGEGEVDAALMTSPPRSECLMCKLDGASTKRPQKPCLHSGAWPCPVQTIGRVNTSSFEGCVTSILVIPFVLFGECPICLEIVLAASIVISVNCGHPMCIFCIVRACAAGSRRQPTDDFGVFDTSKRCSICRTEVGLYLFMGQKLFFHGDSRLASCHQTREYLRDMRMIGIDEEVLPSPEKLIMDTRFGFLAPIAAATNSQVISLDNLIDPRRIHFDEEYYSHPEPSEVSSKVYCRIRCQLQLCKRM
jgi:hypothetical protein